MLKIEEPKLLMRARERQSFTLLPLVPVHAISSRRISQEILGNYGLLPGEGKREKERLRNARFLSCFSPTRFVHVDSNGLLAKEEFSFSCFQRFLIR